MENNELLETDKKYSILNECFTILNTNNLMFYTYQNTKTNQLEWVCSEDIFDGKIQNLLENFNNIFIKRLVNCKNYDTNIDEVLYEYGTLFITKKEILMPNNEIKYIFKIKQIIKDCYISDNSKCYTNNTERIYTQYIC